MHATKTRLRRSHSDHCEDMVPPDRLEYPFHRRWCRFFDRIARVTMGSSPPRNHREPSTTDRSAGLCMLAVLFTLGTTTLVVSPVASASPLLGLGLVLPKPVVLGVGALICALASAMAWRGRRCAFRPVDAALATYAITSLLALVSSRPALAFWGPWWTLQASAVAVLAAASWGARSRKELLIDGMVWISVVVALVAIYESAGGALPWEASRRPGATFANRNAVGGFCAIALPLAMARLVERPRLGRALLVSSLALAVLLCRARSSWLALLGTFVLTAPLWWRLLRPQPPAIFSPWARRYLCLAAALTVSALLLLPWRGLAWREASPVWSSASRLIDYENGTGRARVQQHKLGLAMIAEGPWLGFGPGGWRRESSRFVHEVGEHTSFVDSLWTPASDPLRHAVEAGVPSLVAAAAMALTLLWGVRRRVFDRAQPLTLALASSLLVALTISTFDALLTRPASVVLVAAVAGVLRQEVPPRLICVPASLPGVALFLATSLGLFFSVPRYFASQALARHPTGDAVLKVREWAFPPYEARVAVMIAARTQPCWQIAPAAARVAKYLPQEPELLLLLARCAIEAHREDDARGFLAHVRKLEPHDPRLGMLERSLARPAPAVDVALTRELLSYYPMGIGLSPDGSRLLTKSRRVDDFALEVFDALSGQRLATATSSATQLSLTWAPDGGSIIFLQDNDGDRHFRVMRWDLLAQSVSQLSRLETQSAAPPIRWSADGHSLLLYRGGARLGTLELVSDVRNPRPLRRSLGEVSSEGDFRFAPDGSRIALVREPASGTVVILPREEGAAEVARMTVPGARVSQFDWAPDGRTIGLTARLPDQPYYALFSLEVATGKIRLVFAPRADVSNPVILPDGKRFVVEVNRDGRFELVLGFFDGSQTPRVLTAANETFRLLDLVDHRDRLVVRGNTLSRSAEVGTLDLAPGSRVIFSAGQKGVDTVTPRLISVPAPAGQPPVPTVLWVPENSHDRPHAAVIFVHGGPHLQEFPTPEGRIGVPLSRGIAVALPNYRGSRGYGVFWEAPNDPALAAQDLLAVQRYLTAELAIPASRIVVVASSWGTLPALRLARESSQPMGTLILTSLVEPPMGSCPQRTSVSHVVGFHGARDPGLSAARAQEVFVRCTGASADTWHVLPDEGHQLHRTRSWAQILDEVVRATRR
jgi:Tetratricopeptide repeat/O-Antigen ligase